jgi:D-xylose transport system substrate-binding protein
VRLIGPGAPSSPISLAEVPEAWQDAVLALSRPASAFAGLPTDRPLVMGILNVTPDSFSDGGRHADHARAIQAGHEMLEAGADLLDIGGESTRPGATPVPPEEECRRILPVIRELAKAATISVDTRNAATMLAALEAGAEIVNDVTALRHDPAAARVLARSEAGVILMHMLGDDPRTMQRDPRYDDVALEVAEFLAARLDWAEQHGIARERIALDPGIGFGKRIAHNLTLIERLPLLAGLGCRIVVGASRKRFIGELSGVEIAEDRSRRQRRRGVGRSRTRRGDPARARRGGDGAGIGRLGRDPWRRGRAGRPRLRGLTRPCHPRNPSTTAGGRLTRCCNWEERMAKTRFGAPTRRILLGTALALPAITARAQGRRPMIGVSWSNFQEERWKTDEAAMQAAIRAGGGSYVSADAQSSPAKQLTDIESLLARGAKALIVLAQDNQAVRPGVQRAINEGVPVIAYDRLIEMPEVFYLTFDNVEVGRMMARAIQQAKPEGNYAFIKGSSADPNADFLFRGTMEVLKPAIDAGRIRNVGEAYTDGWLPANAQRNMEQFLTRNNNRIDAVIAANDGTAGGAIAALAAQGLAGSVPVSGQDADRAALNRIAQGTQTLTIWKDARELGRTAAEIAVRLAGGTRLSEIPNATQWNEGPQRARMTARFLTPVPVNRDNLGTVIEAGWAPRAAVCQGVPAGRVQACS